MELPKRYLEDMRLNKLVMFHNISSKRMLKFDIGTWIMKRDTSKTKVMLSKLTINLFFALKEKI